MQKGTTLHMAPNIISRHLRVWREAGWVEVARDPLDARWVYYSINVETLDTFRSVLGAFFDPARLRPRQSACGPDGALTARRPSGPDRRNTR